MKNAVLKTEVDLINIEMKIVKTIFLATVNLIPSFDITNKKVLPYGLRPHTRSISWIVEQVITQQAKYHAQELGITDVEFDMADTCLHDCIVVAGGIRYFVNVKIHNMGGKKNKNDISAVEKLYMQYIANPNYRLMYVTFGINFQNLTITFDKESVHVFSPQFLPVYVNPRNDKIQAYYHHEEVYRTRQDFLRLLRENSKSIVLE
ncbi:hypothetical protein BH24ACI1_BH24ACI1_28890 [soil metagenome]